MLKFAPETICTMSITSEFQASTIIWWVSKHYRTLAGTCPRRILLDIARPKKTIHLQRNLWVVGILLQERTTHAYVCLGCCFNIVDLQVRKTPNDMKCFEICDLADSNSVAVLIKMSAYPDLLYSFWIQKLSSSACQRVSPRISPTMDDPLSRTFLSRTKLQYLKKTTTAPAVATLIIHDWRLIVDHRADTFCLDAFNLHPEKQCCEIHQPLPFQLPL